MSSAQAWAVGVLAALVFGRLIQAITTKHASVVLELGVPAAGSAVAGGLRLLLSDAQAIEGVKSINGGLAISGAQSYDVTQLKALGHSLLVDDLVFVAVYVIVLGIILFEVTSGVDRRRRGPVGVSGVFGWIAHIGLGYAAQTLLGVTALTLIYLRS